MPETAREVLRLAAFFMGGMCFFLFGIGYGATATAMVLAYVVGFYTRAFLWGAPHA